MHATMPRHRSTIVNCATRYEITMTTPQGTTVLGYTARRTRDALIVTMQAHKDAVLAALGDGNDFGWDVKAFRFSNPQGFSVGFSGRTEREAADAIR